MALRILAWNLNHRARQKAIPPRLVEVITALDVDVIVLNEYVHGEKRVAFLAELSDRGYPYYKVSQVTPVGENHVLIASRSPVEHGSIKAPPIEKSIPSNFLHIVLPQNGCERVGLRIPEYSDGPKIKRACRNWIIETASTLKERPSVMIGDFNTDPDDPSALCADCIEKLTGDGWQLASPREGASWWWSNKAKNCVVPFRIDHAFVSQHFEVSDSRYVSDFGGVGSLGNGKEFLSDHAPLLIVIKKMS